MKNLNYSAFVLLLFILISCQENEAIESPEESYLKEVTIDSELHLEHLGQITFMTDYVPITKYSKGDMITKVELPLNELDKVDMNIRAFLNNTLTNHLLALAPQKSISDLVSNGNYQFTFIVDGKKVYVENLNTGAGTAYTKNQYTSLCVPLLSSAKEDSWGRFLWARFMSRGGGQEALNEGIHNLKIEIRPYVEIDKLLVGDIIAQGSLEINMVDNSNPINLDKIKMQTILPSEDWNNSSQEINVEFIESLNKNIHKGIFKDVTSIVAIKNNDLLVEEYFNGSTRASLHDTRSVGKSITSAIMGLAISDGHIQNEDVTIDKFYDLKKYDKYSPNKESISIKDLLTMTSSFAGSDDDSNSAGSEDRIQSTNNWMEYTLNLPSEESSHSDWTYFTGGTMMLGDIIDKSVPNGIKNFTKEKLFDPLNIQKNEWFHTPQGLPYGGGGLQLTTLDLAKIGSLYVNNGKWKGEQILEASWIEKSLSNHVSLPDERGDSYGYLWYNTSFEYEDKSISYSYAIGNGGNMICVLKDIQLVVVITAQAYNTIEGSVQASKMLERFILPAILEI